MKYHEYRARWVKEMLSLGVCIALIPSEFEQFLYMASPIDTSNPEAGALEWYKEIMR